MNQLAQIPDELGAFLVWLKQATEKAWETYRTKSLQDFQDEGVGGVSWQNGTHWKPGLSADRLIEIQARWRFEFPADYRRFLTELNCPDRGAVSAGWMDEPPYAMEIGPDVSIFSDWEGDRDGISAAIEDVRAGLLFAVENHGFWASGWGKRPDDAALSEPLIELLDEAPSLVPITGSRFLVSGMSGEASPVLSIRGNDAIVYADSLRSFLLLEFSSLLNLDYRSIVESQSLELATETLSSIPFWGPLLLAD